MPDFVLAARAASGKRSKLRIAASTFDSAVRKAAKAGYADIRPFAGAAPPPGAAGTVGVDDDTAIAPAVAMASDAPPAPVDGGLTASPVGSGRRPTAIQTPETGRGWLTAVRQRVMRLHWGIRYGAVILCGLIVAGLTYRDRGDHQDRILARLADEAATAEAAADGLGEAQRQALADAYAELARLMPSSADADTRLRTIRGRDSGRFDVAAFTDISRRDLAAQLDRLRRNRSPGQDRIVRDLAAGAWIRLARSTQGTEVYSVHTFSFPGEDPTHGTCTNFASLTLHRPFEPANTPRTMPVSVAGDRLTWQPDPTASAPAADPDRVHALSDRFMLLDEMDGTGRYSVWLHLP